MAETKHPQIQYVYQLKDQPGWSNFTPEQRMKQIIDVVESGSDPHFMNLPAGYDPEGKPQGRTEIINELLGGPVENVTTPPNVLPSTNPAAVPFATAGVPSPLEALGGFLRTLGLQGFEDTGKYPTPRFTHQPSPAEQEVFKQQRAGLPPNATAQAAVAGLRAPLAFASGVAGGTGDVLNAPGAVSQLVGGPDFKLPIGSDSVARQFGIPPESMSALERTLQGVGGFVSPGLFLKVAEGVGILPSAARKLYPFVSAGPKVDVALGTVSTAGSAVGAQVTPGSPVGPLVGGVGAPLTVIGARALISQGIKTFGKPIVLRQDAEEAERIARTTQQESAIHVRIARERIDAAKADLADRVQRGEMDEASMQRALARIQQTGEQSITTAFDPLRDELTQGVLKTRTTGGTPRAIPQVPPGTQEVGKEARTAATEGQTQLNTQLVEESKKIIESLGPALNRIGTLGAARRFFRETFFKEGRENLGKLFDATEKVTGDVPVVQTNRLEALAMADRDEAVKLGRAVPQQRGAVFFADEGFGFSKDELHELLTSDSLKVKPLTDEQKTLVQTILDSPDYADKGMLPFAFARRLESALNEIAYRGANPIGTITQGKARRYVAGMQDDIHDFLVSPAATTYAPEIEAALTPFGGTAAAEPTISGALDLAKAKYRDFIQTSNNTIVSKILSNNTTVQRQFLHPFTTPTGDVGVLTDIKKVASPEVWDTLGAFTMAEGHRIASASGQFDIGTMQNWLKGLRKSGKMDILYTPEQVANIERYATKMTEAAEEYIPRFRAVLRNNPEDVLPLVFKPGNFTETQNFKAIMPEEVFDTAVKAHAADMLQDLATLTPEAFHQKYMKLFYRDRIGGGVGHGGGYAPSQLDIMLTEYPKDVADRMTQAFDSLKPRQAQAKADVERAQNVLRELQERTAEGFKVETENVAATAAMQKATATEEKTLTDFADEQLRILKKKAGVPEDVMVYGYGRFGPLHLRTSAAGNATLALALGESMIALIAGQPLYALAGVTAAGTVVGLQNAAYSAAGKAAIRQGLTGKWAPSSARWAAQALNLDTPKKSEATLVP